MCMCVRADRRNPLPFQMIVGAKDVVVERKEEIWDLVTQYDRLVEEVLIRKLKEQFPNHKYVCAS